MKLHCTPFATADVYYYPTAPYTIVKVKKLNGRAVTEKQLVSLQKQVHSAWGYRAKG